MKKTFRCPVCGKSLSEKEFENALGLWKKKQEHIKHLENEQKRLKVKEIEIKKILEKERKKIKEQETLFKKETLKKTRLFKNELTKLKKETRNTFIAEQKKSVQKLKLQKERLEKNFEVKINLNVQKGIKKGIEKQLKEFKRKESDYNKTKNKMLQLENSLKLSARKYENANEEIRKLKDQIEKGITPQIEGLLEETVLLKKLKELFPNDRFDHPGKRGDIIQYIVEQNKVIGSIIYECKKVKTFNKKHVLQTQEARRIRKADFAILVTNSFPSKKQYYFVEKNVFVINPISLEPITYTLRESIVKIAILRINNEAKEKAVQKVYDFLSSQDYNNKMNDVASQLIDLASDLNYEIKSHRDRWEKRFKIYKNLFLDVGSIDFQLKGLIQNQIENKKNVLQSLPKEFINFKII